MPSECLETDAKETGASRVEVTPEMITAGAKALQAWQDGEFSLDDEPIAIGPWEIGARSIYEAMQKAAKARHETAVSS